MDGQFLFTMSAINIDDAERDEKIKLVPKYFDKFFVITNLTSSYKSQDFNNDIISINPTIRNQSISTIKTKFDEQLLALVKDAQDRKELDEPFKYEFFKNVGYNQFGKKFLRYFFARIDHYISDFSELNEFGTYHQLVLQANGKDVYHIEHILTNRPENVKLFDNEEEFNTQRNRLGNLLLLKGKDNESSNDELYCEPSAPSDKLRTYNVAGTYFARTLLSDMYNKKVAFKRFIEKNNLNFKAYPKTYTKTEIEERHHLLYVLSKRIWDGV